MSSKRLETFLRNLVNKKEQEAGTMKNKNIVLTIILSVVGVQQIDIIPQEASSITKLIDQQGAEINKSNQEMAALQKELKNIVASLDTQKKQLAQYDDIIKKYQQETDRLLDTINKHLVVIENMPLIKDIFSKVSNKYRSTERNIRAFLQSAKELVDVARTTIEKIYTPLSENANKNLDTIIEHGTKTVTELNALKQNLPDLLDLLR